MPKSSQKIVLFIEPNDDAWFTPSKIGHLFMNRFAIDEDPGFEIVNVNFYMFPCFGFFSAKQGR